MDSGWSSYRGPVTFQAICPGGAGPAAPILLALGGGGLVGEVLTVALQEEGHWGQECVS